MNKKEIKNWVKQIVEKGYDKSDMLELLEVQKQKGLIDANDISKIEEEYDNQFAEVEKNKIGFFERRRLKKQIRKVHEFVDEASKQIQELTQHTKALNKKEKEALRKLREEMEIAIVGDIEKGKTGLNQVFDIEDEETGQSITKEGLSKYTLEELEELLRDLLEALEKEI